MSSNSQSRNEQSVLGHVRLEPRVGGRWQWEIRQGRQVRVDCGRPSVPLEPELGLVVNREPSKVLEQGRDMMQQVGG